VYGSQSFLLIPFEIEREREREREREGGREGGTDWKESDLGD